MLRTDVNTQSAAFFGKLLLAVSVEPDEVGRRIKAAREKRGWTQLEFALEASVSPSTVQRWESGRLPRVRELMRVADLLGIPVDQLVEPAEEEIAVAERLERIERVLEALVARLEERGGEDRRRAQSS